MAEGAKATIGTTLAITDPVISMTELETIGAFGWSSDEIEVTTLADTMKQYISGVQDGGEFSIGGSVSDTTKHGQLIALVKARTVVEFTYTDVHGGTYVFDGFIKEYKVADTNVNEVYKFEGTIRITGEITYTPAVS